MANPARIATDLLTSPQQTSHKLMQKFIVILAGFFFFIAVLVSSSGCKKEESPGTEYTIQIDSITHPDTITAGEMITIKYYGLLGLTDCFAFERFDVDYDDNVINTTAIGLIDEDDNCVTNETILNGRELNLFDLPAGDFIIQVNRPRNGLIESPVHVKQD